MRYFRIIAGGEESYVIWPHAGRPAGDRVTAVPRLPEAWERWDDAAQDFVRDDASAIDAAHLAQHGANAIARVHARKEIEADLILGGVPLPEGLLAAEAEATGQDLIALARIVAGKAAAPRAAELNRILAKRAARAAGGHPSKETKNG